MATFAQMMEGPNRLIETSKYDKEMSRLTKLYIRQVGWLIAGGPHDGEFVAWPEQPRTKFLCIKNGDCGIGSYSPVYIELGD